MRWRAAWSHIFGLCSPCSCGAQECKWLASARSVRVSPQLSHLGPHGHHRSGAGRRLEQALPIHRITEEDLRLVRRNADLLLRSQCQVIVASARIPAGAAVAGHGTGRGRLLRHTRAMGWHCWHLLAMCCLLPSSSEPAQAVSAHAPRRIPVVEALPLWAPLAQAVIRAGGRLRARRRAGELGTARPLR